jgi:hypothetical protein
MFLASHHSLEFIKADLPVARLVYLQEYILNGGLCLCIITLVTKQRLKLLRGNLARTIPVEVIEGLAQSFVVQCLFRRDRACNKLGVVNVSGVVDVDL